MEAEGDDGGELDNHVSDDNLGSCGSVDDAKTPEDDTESLNQSLSSPGCGSALSSLQSPSASLASPLNLLASPLTPQSIIHNTDHQSMYVDIQTIGVNPQDINNPLSINQLTKPVYINHHSPIHHQHHHLINIGSPLSPASTSSNSSLVTSLHQNLTLPTSTSQQHQNTMRQHLHHNLNFTTPSLPISAVAEMNGLVTRLIKLFLRAMLIRSRFDFVANFNLPPFNPEQLPLQTTLTTLKILLGCIRSGNYIEELCPFTLAGGELQPAYGELYNACDSGELQHVHGELQHVCGELQHYRGELQHVCGELQHDCGELQHDCGELQHDCGELQLDCGELQHDCGELQHDCGELQHECGELQHDCGHPGHNYKTNVTI
ncbi:Protein pangolin, isoform J, partial [Pseudolycoriella hygida]